MMRNTTMELWQKVEKTEEGLIREIKEIDGKRLKSIAPINKIKKATELWGSYGAKWGLKQIKHSEQKLFQSLILGVMDAVFFYPEGDEVVEFEISNSIPIVSQKEKQLSVNMTYRKAIETDTIGKALSRLGFNADLYTDGDLMESGEQEAQIEEMDLIQIGGDKND